MSNLAINAERFLARLKTLGEIGRDDQGRLVRLAGTDADRAGRDQLVTWLGEAGLAVEIDQIGNIFGIWTPEGAHGDPVLVGSHIDSVIDAGIYDGCTGVLGGLEVIQTLKESGITPSHPIAVAAFTNEEGVRFAPDMTGSLVFVGGLSVTDSHTSIGTDGARLGAELARIGYHGAREPGFFKPHAYVELHIEQGPILDRDGIAVGAVENLQGISWQRVTISGVANHAGTTPMDMRHDAGFAAASVITFLRSIATGGTVATVGTIRFIPDAINVIPSQAAFTVDLRDPDETRLQAAEAVLAAYLDQIAKAEGVTISTERLARFAPVMFDPAIVGMVEDAAHQRGLSVRRMTSGAGHDAQMMARLAPTAMIFVPSVDGISHNPREHTAPDDLVAGANVLLSVVERLAR